MRSHTAPEFNQMERVGKFLHAYKKKIGQAKRCAMQSCLLEYSIISFHLGCQSIVACS